MKAHDHIKLILDDVCERIRNGETLYQAVAENNMRYGWFSRNLLPLQKAAIADARAYRKMISNRHTERAKTFQQIKVKHEADALALYETLSVRERKIIDKAAELYDIKPHYILLRTRQRKISEPRFMVCRIFHQRFDYTLDFTASKVCVKGLDHSSVINGIKRTYSLSKYDDKFRAGMNSLFELAAVIMMERKAFTAMSFKPKAA